MQNGCSQEKDKSKELCLSTKQAKVYLQTTFLFDYFCDVKQAYMPIWHTYLCVYSCTRELYYLDRYNSINYVKIHIVSVVK